MERVLSLTKWRLLNIFCAAHWSGYKVRYYPYTRKVQQPCFQRDINSVAATAAGVCASDEGGALNVRGGQLQHSVFCRWCKSFGVQIFRNRPLNSLTLLLVAYPRLWWPNSRVLSSISTGGLRRGESAGKASSLFSHHNSPINSVGNSLGFSVGAVYTDKRFNLAPFMSHFFLLPVEATLSIRGNPTFLCPSYVVKRDEPIVGICNPANLSFLQCSAGGLRCYRSSELCRYKEGYVHTTFPGLTLWRASFHSMVKLGCMPHSKSSLT